MGSLAPHLESVKSKAITLPYKIDIKVDVGNMAEIMANSDVAIGAAGSTTWERCCLGLPTIQIVIAENQTFLAKELAHYNAIRLVIDTKEISSLLENSDDWLKVVSAISSQICDGMGVYRVFNRMSDHKMILDKFGEVELCNYINLNLNEKILVLNMRNHPDIKKWMYNQESILQKDHIRFIEDLESKMDKRYFLIKQKGNIVGSINFLKINLSNSVKFGIYTNPFLKLKNSGGLLESVVSQYAFAELGVRKLKLEVFSDNERAINFYNKCGFKVINIENKNHKNILHMQKERILGNV